MSTETVALLGPEIILVLGALAIYLAGTLVATRVIWSWAAGFVLLAAGFVLSGQPEAPADILGPIAFDGLSDWGRRLAIVLGLLFVLLCSKQEDEQQSPEFMGTLLLLVVGIMLAVGARDLILLFLGLELISIPSYVLLYMARRGSMRDLLAEEAAAKYFFLSVFSSALLLYGLSFLYGAAGSTSIPEIYAALTNDALPQEAQLPMLQLALLLVFAGLGFKVTAVPFHFYAPDVYQGTSHAAAALLAVAPKVAGFVALIRVVCYAMPDVAFYGWRIALVLALLTMTVGNVLALRQRNIRRMLAYSSIAHAGYMLIGVTMALAWSAVPDSNPFSGVFDPVAAVVVYLTVYAIATVGIFAALTFLGKPGQQINELDELSGQGFVRPVPALVLTLLLFSLAGVPPLAGFWGKLSLFMTALTLNVSGEGTESLLLWSIILAVVGVLNAAIAATYYLRMIAVMYFQPLRQEAPAAGGLGALWSGVLATTLIVGIGILPGTLSQAALQASRTSRQVITKPVAASVPTVESTEQQVAAAE